MPDLILSRHRIVADAVEIVSATPTPHADFTGDAWDPVATVGCSGQGFGHRLRVTGDDVATAIAWAEAHLTKLPGGEPNEARYVNPACIARTTSFVHTGIRWLEIQTRGGQLLVVEGDGPAAEFSELFDAYRDLRTPRPLNPILADPLRCFVSPFMEARLAEDPARRAGAGEVPAC